MISSLLVVSAVYKGDNIKFVTLYLFLGIPFF